MVRVGWKLYVWAGVGNVVWGGVEIVCLGRSGKCGVEIVCLGRSVVWRWVGGIMSRQGWRMWDGVEMMCLGRGRWK